MALNLSALLKETKERVGLLPELVKQTWKTAESQVQAKKVAELETKLNTSALEKPTFQLPKVSVFQPPEFITKETMFAKSTETIGHKIEQKISESLISLLLPKPIERTSSEFQNALKAFQNVFETPSVKAIIEPLIAISKAVGGIVSGKIVPRKGETIEEYYQRQPMVMEVVQKELEKTGIPVLPIVGGFLAELLVPPYFGKSGKFIDELARITDKGVIKTLLTKGIKNISEKDADDLAIKLSLITDKTVIKAELDIFAKTKKVGAPEVPKLQPLAQEAGKIPTFRDIKDARTTINLGGGESTIQQSWVSVDGKEFVRIKLPSRRDIIMDYDLLIGKRTPTTATEISALKDLTQGEGRFGITDIALHKPSVNKMVELFKTKAPSVMERPIALIKRDGKISVLEGEHRFAAAKIAKVEPPMVLLTEKQTTNLNAPQIDTLARKVFTGKNTKELTDFYQAVKGEVKPSPEPLAQEARKYLYHGTNEQMLNSITKEGLKPSMKGTLSLSKDEVYAKSFAKYGMTPQGKTEPVMFRVKADLLKGKTVYSDKARPALDQLNEILTKEVIPPESLEVYKNGKWQPLKSQAVKGVKPVLPRAEVPPIKSITEPSRLPVVIQGETFTLGTGDITRPDIVRAKLKAEIKATKEEIKNAEIATKKAQHLEVRQQKIRQDAIENINRFHGDTGRITKLLKSRNLADEDIANIVLEDGTKFIDTVKIKRNPDKSLAAVITKKELEELATGYTGKIPKEKWARVGAIQEAAEKGISLAKMYELSQVWFERKGLNKLYDPIIEAGRGAEVMRTSFIKQFKEAGLWKPQGWFTADRFNLSKTEAEHIGQYYLTRQGKGYNIVLENLNETERKFVEIFDGIIKETEPRFFETAKKAGRTPGVVENYAPIMTAEDIKLVDQAGAMDWLFRKHPAFFSLKERVKKVPVELYETDYRKVAARWMDGITQFVNLGEETPKLKYLIESDQFRNIVNQKDHASITKWLKDIVNPSIPETAGAEAVDFVSRLLRKGTALAALGLNYASVIKQALTQIPMTLIEKAPPKLRSEYAKAFNISVGDLPSITKRKGDIAIVDLQGKIGRIFTGALTEFDRKNAQISLNRLLDKEYNKFLKQGAEITPEIQKLIEKTAQDKIDLWYGGFFKGQKPEAFRSSLGQFINMFIYPLTSQLNGFYRHILQARGAWKTAQATAEVMAAATAIAYMEASITKLSFKWSDEKEMTKDVLQSLAGNIPIVSQISYAIMEDQQLQVSAGIAGISNLMRKIPQYLKDEKDEVDLFFATGEVVGLPKQFRRLYEGMEIIEEGGITSKEGKMLAPVKDADEIIRSVLRGKYGSLAAQDWIKNIGEKSENRRWFVPQVEFLQNGDYNRKAELYNQFSSEEQKELRSYLSENQQKKLDNALKKKPEKKTLEDIFSGQRSLESIFK